MSKSKVMVAIRDQLSVDGSMTLARDLNQGTDVDRIAMHVVPVSRCRNTHDRRRGGFSTPYPPRASRAGSWGSNGRGGTGAWC
jgi:hypothetical protein